MLHRLRPVADRVRMLTASPEVSAVLQVVRHCDADDGERETIESVITDNGVVLDKVPGQHQFLGRHLAAEDLVFLAYAGDIRRNADRVLAQIDEALHSRLHHAPYERP